MVTVNQAIVWAANAAKYWHLMPPNKRANAAAETALWHLGHDMNVVVTRKPGQRWQDYVRQNYGSVKP